jgi:hypothetical protein
MNKKRTVLTLVTLLVFGAIIALHYITPNIFEYFRFRGGGGGGGTALPEGWVSVKDHGGVGDARVVTDAAMTSGSAVLTSATAAFTSADVGKSVSINGVGVSGGILQTTISGFTNSTTVTLVATAGTTASSQCCAFGTDNTSAVQAAIAAASSTVFFPAGNYFFAGSIGTLPVSISLVGANQFGPTWLPYPISGNPLDFGGTILLLTANAGNGSGTKFISASSNSAIIGFTFYWPNQLTANSTAIPYPWAIYLYFGGSCSVQYCAFINAYQAIYAEYQAAALFEEIRGEALYRGIQLEGNNSVTRLRGVYFDDEWGRGTNIDNWRQGNSIAFNLGRNDGTILEGCFCFNYHTWIHFYDDAAHGGSSWAQIRGGGADGCGIPIQIDQAQMQGIDIDGVWITLNAIGVANTFAGDLRIHNSMFFCPGGQFGSVDGSGDVTVDNCDFVCGNSLTPPTLSTTGWTVRGTGNFTLRNCVFHVIQPCNVSLGASLIGAIVVGNMSSDTAFHITNNLGVAAVIGNNTGGENHAQTLYIGADLRLVPITGGGKLQARNPGTNTWADVDQWTNP